MDRLTAADVRNLDWLHGWLLQGIRFLAVVWSIAGAFLVLQIGAPWLLQEAITRGWIAAELAMPGMARGEAGVRCAETAPPSADARDAGPISPSALPHARYAAWQLGRHLGALAAAGAGTPLDEPVPSVDDLGDLAGAVGVPTPVPPKVQHPARALHEFEIYLEQDPQCVAAQFTRKYAPSFGHLYKLGAVVGYAAPSWKRNLGAVFVAQIRLYGSRAEIPEALWLPMTQDRPDNFSEAKTRERTRQILTHLDDYLKAAP